MPDGYEQRDLDLDFLTPSLASLLTQQIRLAELQQRRQPAVPTEARVEEVEGEEIEPACLGAFETERSWRDGG